MIRGNVPDIKAATPEEQNWAANLLAGSEPWMTLGTTLEESLNVCSHPEYLLFIGHISGVAAGLIIMHPRGFASSPYIKSIVVAETYRTHGLGSSLMEFAERYFSNESKHIFLCASSFNSSARSFYEKRGYRQVGELKDYVIAGADEILYHKRLR